MKALEQFAGSVSVLVSSCDAFFDCWRPFAFFFRKFWPGCPFPVYLLVNRLPIRSSVVQPIPVGPDRGWASNLQSALTRISTSHILYFQEDYLLTTSVNEERLASDFRFAFEQEAASFCFCDLAQMEPDFGRHQEDFACVPPESNGRTRLQVALWQREALQSLLVPGENAWEMEARGNARSRHLPMYSYVRNDHTPVSYLMSGIVRGLWTPEALALCRAHGLPIIPAFRPALASTNSGRRWRRAWRRVAYLAARLRHGNRPVPLDFAE